jgi:hypothetical protein
MSGKRLKHMRHGLAPNLERWDAERRAERHTPLWRIAVAALGFPGPARRWITRWERAHAEDMRRRFKRTVRRFVEVKHG